MYGKLSANRSNESLRTRLDSSLSDREMTNTDSPPLARPVPTIPPSYLNMKLNTLFGKLNYLRNPITSQMRIPGTSPGLANVFKPEYYQKPVKLKAKKIYDKFSIEDLEEMQPDYNSSEKDKSSPKGSPGGRSVHNFDNFGESDEKMPQELRSSDEVLDSETDEKHHQEGLEGPEIAYGLENSNVQSALDEPVFKSFADKPREGMIGLLTCKQREAKVKRYLEKKRRRKEQLNSKVRYECRKDLADRRYRLQGRFVKLEDIKKLEKDYIFDSRTKKLIKPIFRTEKIIGGYKSLSSNSNLNSDSDVAMQSSDE